MRIHPICCCFWYTFLYSSNIHVWFFYSRANLSILLCSVSWRRCNKSKKVNCDLICFTLNQSWILISNSRPFLPLRIPLLLILFRRWIDGGGFLSYSDSIHSESEVASILSSLSSGYPKSDGQKCTTVSIVIQIRCAWVAFIYALAERINSNRHFNFLPHTSNYH